MAICEPGLVDVKHEVCVLDHIHSEAQGQLGTRSARHWQLGTPGKGLACGRPILPDLAYMVTVDFHRARKTGPESGSE